MKKFLLLTVFLFASSVSFSQSVFSLFGKANEFFALLNEQKFEVAHKFFDEKEQAKITPDNLKQLWTNINTNLGDVISLEAIQSKTQDEFFAVTLEGKFKKDDQNFVLLFNKNEKVVGLYFPPKPVTYIKPLYADTNTYTEKSVYLQTDSHKLAAIVTTPKNVKNFAMVVLVHGSGPSDMDETLGPNKPFKDLATGLATQGIGSIRYVKRTLVYANEFSKVFTVKQEVTDDALSAIALAKTIKDADVKNIYIFGHSLGGMLAPKLAILAPSVKGIILAAAPARKFTDVIISQNKYMFALAKDTTAASNKILESTLLEIEKSRINKLGALKPDSLIIGLPVSYWIDLNQYDQVATAKKLNKQRIFVLQGGFDFQVGEETDFNLWNTALGKKPNVKLKLYPTLNHLLTKQTEKGTVQQYQIPANVDQEIITDLAAWIKMK